MKKDPVMKETDYKLGQTWYVRERVDEVNCHGCRYLDRYKVDGRGYCCMAERSKTQSEKVRRPEMKRCERYEEGDFRKRWESERCNQQKRCD